jgi:hypothetical protein
MKGPTKLYSSSTAVLTSRHGHSLPAARVYAPLALPQHLHLESELTRYDLSNTTPKVPLAA